jgi:hypothetical protein
MQMMEKTVCNQFVWRLFASTTAMFATMAILAFSPAIAEEPLSQESFGSPQQAVAALVAAVKADNDTELLAILGPDAEDLIYSGDPVADQNDRARFIKFYEMKNSLEKLGAERTVLLLGGKNFPLPIPLVQQGDNWIFDTEAGREEILNRRIGKNELHTIEVMHAYTAAQREYACIHRDGERQEFAQKFSSSAGKKEGLYWETGENEAASPFGPLIARATEEGYRGGLDEIPPEPFYGYYFKILKAQGEHATGGAFNYVADGKMVLGFALAAYPAKYGVSGIMTFIVNQEGVIYEKDLGEVTATTAAAIASYDPDSTWHQYQESAEP